MELHTKGRTTSIFEVVVVSVWIHENYVACKICGTYLANANFTITIIQSLHNPLNRIMHYWKWRFKLICNLYTESFSKSDSYNERKRKSESSSD
jgi:hypothetical protein